MSKLFPIALLAILAILFAGRAAPTYAAAVVGPSSQRDFTDIDQIEPAPILSGDTTWAGIVLILILSLFLAAACIGPIVRAEFPGGMLPVHSHDEPPGTSGRHGTSGEAVRDPYRFKP
jgi:hypothetical protein